MPDGDAALHAIHSHTDLFYDDLSTAADMCMYVYHLTYTEYIFMSIILHHLARPSHARMTTTKQL